MNNKQHAAPPTPPEIREMIPHIRYEITSLVLGSPLDCEDPIHREYALIRQAIHCRALYDFFARIPTDHKDAKQKKPREGDDLFASDYGYPSQLQKLNATRTADFEVVNKHITHITATRVRSADKAKHQEELKRLVETTTQECLWFMEHLQRVGDWLPEGEEKQKWLELKRDFDTKQPFKDGGTNTSGGVVTAPKTLGGSAS